MALSFGFRPRSDAERLRAAACVQEAPPRVALAFADDGWMAANLAIGGHLPVWTTGDPRRAEAVLAALGLPPLGHGEADAVLRADLSWERRGRPGTLPQAPVDGPLVTVLVCTYNRAHLLGESLASALAQGWPCEVLVVDDGSTDATPEICASTPGIRVLRQEPNQGKPAALARGVAEARGEAIVVLDDDDLLLPGAIRVLAHALFSHPELVAVWGDTVLFDGQSGESTAVRPSCRLPGAMARQAVLQQIPAMPGATLIRTAAWRAVGPIDPSLIRGQDMDLFLSLSRRGPMEALPLSTFRYRVHDGLRGSAAGQWKKQDQATHRARFLSFVRPVFRRRWLEASPVPERELGHAWAMGLWQRDLPEEARAELARWPGPWSPAEAWVREQVGLPTEARRRPGCLVVVDDGDEGALEACLQAQARGEALWVDLEVPRDPLGNVRLYWPGEFGRRERLGRWVRDPGPWRLALSSAPDWSMGVDDLGLLPDLPAPEALLATAAVLGVPRPRCTRPGLLAEAPIAGLAWRAREAVTAGRPAEAMGALEPMLSRLPGWRGAWRMAAEAFAALGLRSEAERCAARA